MENNVRQLAAQVTTQVLLHQGSLNTQLSLIEQQCATKDCKLLYELCYGTFRFYPQLNAILNELLHQPLKKKDTDIKALALIGLYQIKHLRIPEHAALHETVNLCRAINKTWATKLINALLRRFLRERQALESRLNQQEFYLFNHPEWMLEKLKHNWTDCWQQILIANDTRAPLTLRINSQKISRNDYLQQLDPELEAIETVFSEHGIQLKNSTNIEELPYFQAGAFSVQDEAAQLAARLLDVKTEHSILDACAAPGGKLCHILERAVEPKRIDALEIKPNRIKRIKQNLSRLNLKAKIIQADAATDCWWDGQYYDRILLDAPCSATGVIRRNPDVKYLCSAESINNITATQYQILTNCWSMLAQGGKLLYATCSIFPQENERLIKRFIEQQHDANLVPISATWGVDRQHGRQLFPSTQGHDGFFYALLQKIATTK